MKQVTEITASDIDNLEFELEKEATKEKKKQNYVNNKELYEAFVVYNKKKVEKKEIHLQETLDEFGLDDISELDDQPETIQIEFNRALKTFVAPPLSDTIGKAIMDISYRRCYSPRFVNYAPNWKEEMISDAIETCVKYSHNFDPQKSNNPFAYLTQLVTNAIFQRIKKEHKQQYIKLKLFDQSHGFSGDIDENNVNNEDMQMLNETNEIYQDRLHYIDNYEEMQGMNNKRQKRKKKSDGDNILDME